MFRRVRRRGKGEAQGRSKTYAFKGEREALTGKWQR